MASLSLKRKPLTIDFDRMLHRLKPPAGPEREAWLIDQGVGTSFQFLL
jgi:hypothetical protein